MIVEDREVGFRGRRAARAVVLDAGERNSIPSFVHGKKKERAEWRPQDSSELSRGVSHSAANRGGNA